MQLHETSLKVPIQNAAESGAMCKSFKEKITGTPNVLMGFDGENQGFL
jgi:hypothetical protein